MMFRRSKRSSLESSPTGGFDTVIVTMVDQRAFRADLYAELGMDHVEEPSECRYSCKTCGAESPPGVGYVVHGDHKLPLPTPGCDGMHVPVNPLGSYAVSHRLSNGSADDLSDELAQTLNSLYGVDVRPLELHYALRIVPAASMPVMQRLEQADRLEAALRARADQGDQWAACELGRLGLRKCECPAGGCVARKAAS